MNNNVIIEDGLSVVQQRGCGQYTMRLYEILQELNFAPKMERKIFLEKIKNSTVRRIVYIVWLNTIFVSKTLFFKKNTICIFSSTMTPFIRLPHIRYMSIIHDVRPKLFPELSTKIQNLHNNFANWTAVKFSNKLITVSETSKKDICKIYNISPDRIKIIYNTPSITSVKYDSNETILSKFDLEKNNYLFFVGGLDKNKNVQLIIDMFEKLSTKYHNLKLVIAGKKGNSAINNNNRNIILTGFVSNEDIKVLYKNALIYIFPSVYEGFGIPIIDAQMMGCPVVCSDIPIFREICGNSVVLSLLNVKDLATSIEYLIDNEQVRNQLVDLGYKNVKKYSRNTVIKQIKDLV